VLGVRLALVADDELEVAVAQALGHDPRTRSKIIRVTASGGIVQLSGDVVPVAQEIAASVPGVRYVEIGSQQATYR
jgi:osmotically-inducible protein OsmY